MGWIIAGLIIGIVAVFVYVISFGADAGIKGGIVATLFLVPLLLGVSLGSTARVGTGEIAVMTRFGRVTGQELGEGLHFKNPIDKANIYDTKVLKIDANAAAASKDLQDVKANVVVNYELEAGKVNEVHHNVGTEYQAKLIDPAIQEVFKATSAKFDATQLITSRSEVKDEVVRLLRERLAKYGIIVRDVSLVNFGFSSEFTQAIEAKQVAQQGAEKAKYDTQKLEVEAQGKIAAAKGDAEAQRLIRETISPETLQRAAIDKWDGKLPQYFGGDNMLFSLPVR